MITSNGKNKFYHYFTVSSFNELPTEENYNPILSEDFKWETTETKNLEDIYNYLLTLEEFAGASLISS